MRKLLIALLSLALTSSVGAQSCCDFDTVTQRSASSFWWPGMQPAFLADGGNQQNTQTIAAAGEKFAFIGYLRINGARSNTSKTLSTGSIAWLPGSASVTWADASSSLSVGIDTVSTTTGPPSVPADETLDVSGTCEQASCSITASTWKSVTMSSGSLSMTNGTLYAVVFDLTARGGADSLTFRGNNQAAYQMPIPVRKSGGSWALASTRIFPNILITFDDGTLGWLDGSQIYSSYTTNGAYNSGSTPDEKAMIFNSPCDCWVDGFALEGSYAAGGNAELIIYSDPLGTPVAISTTSIDEDQSATTGSVGGQYLIATPVRVQKGKTYAAAVRPTSANNLTLFYWTVSAAAHMAAYPGGTDAYLGTRSDQSGAFAASTDTRPVVWLRFNE